ncbi:hypothetical protein [Streptomyces sp. NPDC048266]|uniref:hypothetical protein n=1 Tax=unclassified Streptomyces TaxID=2593676 RepID=UPI0033E2161B
MTRSARKRAGAALAAVAVLAGLAGCQDGDGASKAAAPASATPTTQSMEEAARAVRAAYARAAASKSAKVEMRVMVSGGQAPGGSTFTGVQAWGPPTADLKVFDSSYLADIPGAPVESRVLTAGGATFVDVGEGWIAQTGGKRWLRIDSRGVAAGDELLLQLTAGLSMVNADLPEELGLLAASPAVKHLGPARASGVPAQVYGGDLSGGKRVEVWIGADGYPLRTVVEAETGGVRTRISTNYSGYGTKTAVKAPAAEDTLGLAELLKGLGRG